jgi:hypothetical protein
MALSTTLSRGFHVERSEVLGKQRDERRSEVIHRTGNV